MRQAWRLCILARSATVSGEGLSCSRIHTTLPWLAACWRTLTLSSGAIESKRSRASVANAVQPEADSPVALVTQSIEIEGWW